MSKFVNNNIDAGFSSWFSAPTMYTKDEVIDMLNSIRIQINQMYLDIDSQKCVSDVIQEKIDELRGKENGT